MGIAIINATLLFVWPSSKIFSSASCGGGDKRGMFLVMAISVFDRPWTLIIQ